MIYRTVCARDNVTLSLDADCMDWLSACADLANDKLERNRDVMAKAMMDAAIYGTAEYELVE